MNEENSKTNFISESKEGKEDKEKKSISNTLTPNKIEEEVKEYLDCIDIYIFLEKHTIKSLLKIEESGIIKNKLIQKKLYKIISNYKKELMEKNLEIIKFIFLKY